MKLKLLMALLLILPIVYADSGSMKILAVSEQNGTYEGRLADLYLAVSPGYGRVYIESQPLSQLDLQFSTRLARDVACDYTEVDCEDYDFFYTIKASSSIVGGPSAGAAATILTTALLSNEVIDNETTITGTINSGGVIGPVGRIKDKIDSASIGKIKKVLIPYGSIEEGVDLIEYGRNKGIEVIEVSDLDDALYHFTGQEKIYAQNISINPKYQTIMRSVAEGMCNQSMNTLKKTLNYIYKEGKAIPDPALEIERSASEFYMKGQTFMDKEKYYSGASQCFGSNVRYREFEYLVKEYGKEEILAISNSTSGYLNELDEQINKESKKYLSDLEAYMIIKERIMDAEKNIQEALKTGSLNALSYAVERANSAFMWSKFFDMNEKKIKLANLETSCLNRLTEVNELHSYVSLFLPNVLGGVDEDIELIRKYIDNKDYELCLFKASKTKADINVILSSIGVSENQIDSLLKRKITAAKKVIIKENSKSVFPILGYSYYEYANSLKDTERYLSLVYSEYGLELSNLDVYFKDGRFSFSLPSFNFGGMDTRAVSFLFAGILVGIVITLFVSRKRKRKKFKGIIKF
ncbi:S16 family serine protease [Nanoarchaeota archaeon]